MLCRTIACLLLPLLLLTVPAGPAAQEGRVIEPGDSIRVSAPSLGHGWFVGRPQRATVVYAFLGAAAGAGLVLFGAVAAGTMDLLTDGERGWWVVEYALPLGAVLGGLIGAELGAERTTHRWRKVPLREIRGRGSGPALSLSVSLSL